MDDDALLQPVRTIVDVARLAGVAPSTVSRSLAGKLGVRPETRHRIAEIARTHGFSINAVAKGLRLGTGSGEGPVSDEDGIDPFLARLAKSVIDLALKCGTGIELAIDDVQATGDEVGQEGRKKKLVTVSVGQAGSGSACYRVTLSKTPGDSLCSQI